MKELAGLQLADFSSSQFRTRLVIAVVLLNLMVAGLAFQSLHQGLEQSRARAAVSTQNIAQLLEHDIAASFDRIDLTLQALVDDVQDELSRPRSTRNFDATVKHHFSRQPALGSLVIANSAGTLIAGSAAYKTTPELLADRDYFRRHRDDAATGLVISPPLRSRLNGEWIITLSRRYESPPGTFAGAVIASVRIDHLRQLFAGIDLGPNGAISLRELDLAMVTRHPQLSTSEASVGSRSVSAQLRAAIENAPVAGTYLASTRMDQIERTNTYRRMARYPYYIIVGLADNDYLSGWHRELIETAVQVAAFLLATLTMTGLVLHAWRCREADLNRIASKEREFRTLLDTAPDAIVIIDDEGRINRANQRMLSEFGYSHDALIGQPASLLLESENMDISNPGRAGIDIELWALRADGQRFPISARFTPIETERGRMVTVAIRDISERREREEALKLASLVYQAVGEAIMVTDTDNRIVAINPAFTQLTGYTQEEAIGQPAGLLHSGRHDHTFFRTMWESLAATGTWKGQILNRRRNGEIVADWLMINTIYDENGLVQWRVGMYSTITEQKRAEETLWRQASYDILTNLPNRRLLLDRLQQEMNIARRSGAQVALMLIDLDHFKDVNDTLGHLAGDQLLMEVARRLQACIREMDTAARLGGDEFAVILGAIANVVDVEPVAEAIRRALAGGYPLKEGDATISASIEIACFPSDADEMEGLFLRADQAMYTVKDKGRNGIGYARDAWRPTLPIR